MDDSSPKPKILANRIIQQMAEHMLAGVGALEPKDYMVVRTVFRSADGSWEAITAGDKDHLELLKEIVLSWGKMRGPVKQSEFI